MAEYGWLGPLRTSLRSAFLRAFGQIVQSNDGRRTLGDALSGLTVRGTIPQVDTKRVYDDLPYPGAPATGPAPVFVTARFRSGSTLLWNVFRNIRSCRAYYEPLNERRWFDPAVRGDRIDRTHRGVEEYWKEYEGLTHLGRWYQPSWNDRRLYMTESDWDPNLAAYIQGLVDAAPNRAVLQFNRVDFRLPWLKRQFPHARIIHLFRHPRDQWCSSLVNPAAFPATGITGDFHEHDHFYLLNWAEDLSFWFPFLDPRSTDRPYELFYYIWKLSWLFGRKYAHASFCFETLCASPESELPRLMAASDVSDADFDALKALIVPQQSKWATYASAGWFEDQERRCEEVLARFGVP